MPEDKPLADQASPALTRDDDHPAWKTPERAPLRRGTIVPGLHWVEGTRFVAGIGQPPICPHAAGIDISEIGPCPLDEDPAAEKAEPEPAAPPAPAAEQPAGE